MEISREKLYVVYVGLIARKHMIQKMLPEIIDEQVKKNYESELANVEELMHEVGENL